MLKRIVVIALIWLTGCGGESAPPIDNSPRPARLLTITTGHHSATQQFVGVVAPASTVEIGFEIDGTLQTLPVREGELVVSGQVLAQLNPERFELALASAQADHELAEKTLSRMESLKASGTVSQADLDEATARAKVTGFAVKTAMKDLEDTTLRAPFEGRVSKRLLENFSPVNRLSPVIRLAPTARVEVVIGVPEQFMANINPDALTQAQVRFTADPDRLFAAQWLDYEAEASRDTQTYDVRFSLVDAPAFPVLPGMTATLILPSALSEPAMIYLPLSALQSDSEGNFFVWIVDQETSAVSPRAIEVGIPNRDSVPILAGLTADEQIVAAGGAWLHQGMRVRPLQAD